MSIDRCITADRDYALTSYRYGLGDLIARVYREHIAARQDECGVAV
jgi:hypothetical protein